MIPVKDFARTAALAFVVGAGFVIIFLLGAALGIQMCGCGAAMEAPDGGDPDGGDVDGGDSDSDSESVSDSSSDSESASETASDTESSSESVSDREGFWTPCISILKGTSNFCEALCLETGIGTCSETCVADLDGDLHGAEGCAGEIAGQVGSCDQLWASYGDLSVRCCCGS